MEPTRVLSALAATFNLTTAVLVIFGVRHIRLGRRQEHQKFMQAALVSSIFFLVAYVSRMAITGPTRFPGTGWIRTFYFFILFTHTPLAIVVVPLALRTFYLARKERFEAHRKLARATFPIWMYVSVTGVLVYLLLNFWPVA